MINFPSKLYIFLPKAKFPKNEIPKFHIFSVHATYLVSFQNKPPQQIHTDLQMLPIPLGLVAIHNAPSCPPSPCSLRTSRPLPIRHKRWSRSLLRIRVVGRPRWPLGPASGRSQCRWIPSQSSGRLLRGYEAHRYREHQLILRQTAEVLKIDILHDAI